MNKIHTLCLFSAFLSLLSLAPAQFLGSARADDEEDSEGQTVTVGKFQLTAPDAWERRKPQSKIVVYEFAALASEGDDTDGRITMMPAGGDVELNVERWRGQFKDARGPGAEGDPEKRTIAGQTVYIVDISGTYTGGGAFAAAEEQPDYRMLGAIIAMKDGNYFVKFVGPQKTVSDHEDNFSDFLKTLSKK